MSTRSYDDRVQRAEKALAEAEAALRELDGEYTPKADNVVASNAVVGGRLVRIVSVISEKAARS